MYTWKQLKIGGGGFVTGLVIHPKRPDIMYARTDVGGAYRWDANSQSWKQLITSQGVPGASVADYSVESIAVDPGKDQIIYVAVGNEYSPTETDTGRILKSTDRGATWQDISKQRWYMAGNGDNRQGGERLAVDPNNSNILYFGSRNKGLWVSTDGGINWAQVNAIPTGTSGSSTPTGVKWVTFDPASGIRNGATKRLYAGVAGQGVYRSDDAGISWQQILTTTETPYDEALAHDGTLYMTTVGAGSVQKYDPATGNWTTISPNSGEGCYSIALDPFNNQRLFVGSCGMRNDHWWRSTDGGIHWDTLKVSLTAPDIPWISQTDETNWLSTGRIVFDPFVQDKLWFAQGTGVLYATNLSDATTNWVFTSKGIEEMVATDVLAPLSGHPLTLTYDRNGFYHEGLDSYPDRPILNEKFSAGLSGDYSGGDPPFVVVVSSDTRSINPSQSGYSTDGGKTWSLFSGQGNYPDLYGGNIAVSANDTNNIVWLPTNNKKPYVTTDRGATWTQISAFANVQTLHTMIWWGSKKALDSDKVDGGTFYIYSTDNGGEFYRSTDGGHTWVKTAQAPSSTDNDAHVFGQIRAVPGYAGSVWASTVQGGLWYTENAGDTWNPVTGVQQARSFGYGAPLNGSSYPTIYLYGQINDTWGIWRSTDKGANWDLIGQYPLNLADQVNTVNGDMGLPGRVYVGFSGNGFVYGDQQNTTR
ncbi:sialidase [Thermosporothrix hazakensis]|uniref:sialidase n=1 Tax=Thermosporothrix hazakensis TaxID=644383 RepID=UPI001475E86A|nr:sialidase [Thermosporothrix hazakensis]